MSISSTNNRNDYIGTGLVDTYPYTYRIFREEDLRVTKRDTDDVETLLVLNTDYTVTGVGDAGGGNVVLSSDLEDQYNLSIRRVLELKQETDIRNGGPFFPEVHEDQMDRHTMTDQQQQDELDRAVKNPESVPPAQFDPTLPADIATANRAIITNSSGDGLILGLPAIDNERIFKSATYAELKALALADPTAQRAGWATDIKKEVFYTADLSHGDNGWIIRG